MPREGAHAWNPQEAPQCPARKFAKVSCDGLGCHAPPPSRVLPGGSPPVQRRGPRCDPSRGRRVDGHCRFVVSTAASRPADDGGGRVRGRDARVPRTVRGGTSRGSRAVRGQDSPALPGVCARGSRHPLWRLVAPDARRAGMPCPLWRLRSRRRSHPPAGPPARPPVTAARPDATPRGAPAARPPGQGARCRPPPLLPPPRRPRRCRGGDALRDAASYYTRAAFARALA